MDNLSPTEIGAIIGVIVAILIGLIYLKITGERNLAKTNAWLEDGPNRARRFREESLREDLREIEDWKCDEEAKARQRERIRWEIKAALEPIGPKQTLNLPFEYIVYQIANPERTYWVEENMKKFLDTDPSVDLEEHERYLGIRIIQDERKPRPERRPSHDIEIGEFE